MDGFFYDAQIEHIVEILKNNLYFAVLESENHKILKSTLDTYYFSIDDELVYMSYYFDFGPLNLSCLYKYCCKVNNFIQCSQGYKRIVHYTTSNPFKRTNAAFLLGSYAIIYLKMEPTDIYQILLGAGGAFKSFVDASQGISRHTINLPDCLNAIQKALSCNFFNFNDFDVVEYDTLDKIQNGDMNWLVPRKFLALIGPSDKQGVCGHPPTLYINYFLSNYVTTVIRLNNKTYNPAAFTNVGIKHYDLFFPDGTVPPKNILIKFLEIAESTSAAIAVHCKAGLGRTGSLIGAYLMKHYNMTAHEAIAWMRVCRPGAVIGQQQQWLEKIQKLMWKEGVTYRSQYFLQANKIPREQYGIYSIEWQKHHANVVKNASNATQLNQCQKNFELKLKSKAKLSYNEPEKVCGDFSFSRKILEGRKCVVNPKISNIKETIPGEKLTTTVNLNSSKLPHQRDKQGTRNTLIDLNSLKYLRVTGKDSKDISKLISSSIRNNMSVKTKSHQGPDKSMKITTKENTNYNSCIEIASHRNTSRLMYSDSTKSNHLETFKQTKPVPTQGEKLNEIKMKYTRNQLNNTQKVNR